MTYPSSLSRSLSPSYTSHPKTILYVEGSNQPALPVTDTNVNRGILSVSPNNSLAKEAASVFQTLFSKIDRSYIRNENKRPNEIKPSLDEISDQKVIDFAKRALENNEYSFQEKLAGGKEVSLLTQREGGKIFSFYETRTQSQTATNERLLEPANDKKVQTGMFTINQVGNRIYIRVFDLIEGISQNFTLAA